MTTPHDKEAAELLPCPFCGSKSGPEVCDNSHGEFSVICSVASDGCGCEGLISEDKARAIEGWNRRAALTASEAKALDAALEEAAAAVSKHDIPGREWVPGSLWDTLSKEASARIRALKSAPTQPTPTGFDAEFLSKRLARVAKLAGIPMPDMTHEQIAEVAGTILGQIAGKLEREARALATPSAPDIKTLVDRFLAWTLPESVCSDLCATDPSYPHRSGTNLLTAVEAEAMFKHVLAAPVQPASSQQPEGWQLVPKEPTEAMLNVYKQWHRDGKGYKDISIYKAMLFAAPQPGAQSKEEG